MFTFYISNCWDHGHEMCTCDSSWFIQWRSIHVLMMKCGMACRFAEHIYVLGNAVFSHTCYCSPYVLVKDPWKSLLISSNVLRLLIMWRPLTGGELWGPVLQLHQQTPHDVLGECLLHACHNVNGRLRGHLLSDRHWPNLHGFLYPWCLGESGPVVNLTMVFGFISYKYYLVITT